MKKFTEKEMEIIKEAFESKTEVLFDCYGRIVKEEDLEYCSESCWYIETSKKETLEQFVGRINDAIEDLNDAVHKAAYGNEIV